MRVFAHYFGLRSDAADAFNAAFRIPNLLQSLFGEGALSASFIPVYAALVCARRAAGGRPGGRRRRRAARADRRRSLVLLGVLATPLLIAVIAPGFTGEKRELTITLVRILFPGAGLLVLSAWCLGVLNSHHQFLLSYAAPVMWNAAMIATLRGVRRRDRRCRAWPCCWRGDRSSAARCSSRVQLPIGRCASRPTFASRSIVARNTSARSARNFVPVFISRGVVQVSAYIDALLASLLPTGAVTGICERAAAVHAAGQPVRHVGRGSRAAGDGREPRRSDGAGASRRCARRLDAGLRRIAFFVVPSRSRFWRWAT